MRVQPTNGRAAVIYTIAVLVALTVACAAYLFAPRMSDGDVVFDTAPDRPIPFGYKMAWLAIRSSEPASVCEALGLVEAVPANWNSGLGTIYDDELGEHHVFVSPPVQGWVFVAGLSLPHPVTRSFVDKCTPLLIGLAGRFPDVQYYFTYPLIDFFAWVRFSNGKLVRAFAINDEGVVWNKGKTTKEERALGLKLFELRGVRGRRGDAGGEMILHPTEDHVMRLAHHWSLDPTMMGAESAPAALGIVAKAPMSWRPERLRKSA